MRTLVMRSEVSGWGQRVWNLSTCSRVTLESKVRNSGDSASSISSSSSSASVVAEEGDAMDDGKRTFPTDETKATISMPWACLRYFSAMAPAATRPRQRGTKYRTAQLGGDVELTNRFTGATPSPTAARFDGILLEVSIVGMARAWIQIGLGIVFRTLILVSDEEANGCPKSDAMFDS